MADCDNLVQICLPTYNGESHLAESLESLLNQTHRNIEIIIVDNASTDQTQSISERFAARDPRVRYHRSEEFVCATENWNRAYRIVDPSRSQFFMWASDDDLWDARYIEKLIQPLQEDSSVVLSYSQFQSIDESGNAIGPIGYSNVRPSGSAFYRVRSLIRCGQYCTIYGLIRISALRWTPAMIDVSFGADLWYMIQLCAEGPFAAVMEPLFFKRTGGISATNDDPSASADPKRVWNLNHEEWKAISALELSIVSKLYIFNRLKVSARLLHPGKSINLYLWPWYLVKKASNPRAFGLRTKLRRWLQRGH
jgi:glycosyltransferase involved in cell wall biosynthesis